MVDLSRNMLAASSSPYLLQHKDDPVHWQEWNEEVLAEAKRQGKMLFVSIGYATCHWCHVMARESFRDPETAELLNANVVSIKVDREQRPDIDRYFLDYVTNQTGSAGWPMSVFLAPDRSPVYGGTYFPLKPAYGLPSFKQVVRELTEGQKKHPGGGQQPFRIEPEQEASPADVSPAALGKAIFSRYDQENHGFGRGAKFPPHTTLLYLLAAGKPDALARRMCTETLETMALRGLHDHLQGGFYRYCVDSDWGIPHFEKMLYDQALHLMTYSLAWKHWHDPLHKQVAGKLLQCLDETFLTDGVAIAAHDADTDHEEGATYVWSQAELEKLLSPEQFKAFARAYPVTARGNFEGTNHLMRTTNEPLFEAEALLLAVRKRRPQPFADRKIVTGWNALLGIALLIHYRVFGAKASLDTAVTLADRLVERHYRNGVLARSSLGGTVQAEGFLEDEAALTALLSMLYEHTRDARWLDVIRPLRQTLLQFRVDGVWMENRPGGDFPPVPASTDDHPIPASASLAEFALQRSAHVLGEDVPELPYRQPLGSDFWNFVARCSTGGVPIIHGPESLPWDSLPAFAVQVPGKQWQECSAGQCRIFTDGPALLGALSAA